MSEEKKENGVEIKKVSDNVYINVSKIKTEKVDLDGNSEEENETADKTKSPEEKSDEDQNQGDETVGIP